MYNLIWCEYCMRMYSPTFEKHTCKEREKSNWCKQQIALIEAEQITDERKILDLEERVRNLENLSRNRARLNSIKAINDEKKSSNWLFWTVFSVLLFINIAVVCLVLL